MRTNQQCTNNKGAKGVNMLNMLGLEFPGTLWLLVYESRKDMLLVCQSRKGLLPLKNLIEDAIRASRLIMYTLHKNEDFL